MTMQDQFEIFTCAIDIITTRGTRRQTIEAPRIIIERQVIILI